MAFQGGAHVNATGVFTDEAATIIAAQIASQISAWEAQFMNLERRTLLDTIGPLNAKMAEQSSKIDEITSTFDSHSGGQARRDCC